MLYIDDGPETRLSITGPPQSTELEPIPHPFSGCEDNNRGNERAFFPTGDYIKNVWKDLRQERFTAVVSLSGETQESLVEDETEGHDGQVELTLNQKYP